MWKRHLANMIDTIAVDGTTLEVARVVEQIKTGQSILDGNREPTRSLAHNRGSERDLALGHDHDGYACEQPEAENHRGIRKRWGR
jgi:hypothetical protein